MTFSTKTLALTAAIVWGGGLFLIGLANLASPSYGLACLHLAASVYPGYHGPAGVGSVIVLTLYGLADGAIGGAIFAGVYNQVAQRMGELAQRSSPPHASRPASP